MSDCVVRNGLTYLTIEGLIALAPNHPLLDKPVKFKDGYDAARNHPDMLVADLTR